jgi:D-alanyl-lipoteichoic acid acyltransferase DltB (MBOAT superfamily)
VLIDSTLLNGVWIAALFAVIFLILPLAARRHFAWIGGLVAAAAYFRQSFAGYVIVSGVAYAAARWIGGRNSSSVRWRWACIMLFSLAAVFTLGRIFSWGRLIQLPGGMSVALYNLDMWSTLRFMTLFWEVGSGVIAIPQFGSYVAWSFLPLTFAGPLLRFSEYSQTASANHRLCNTISWWSEITAGGAKLTIGIGLAVGQKLLTSYWPQAHLTNAATAALLTGPLGFYLTFAGYYQLMTAMGRPTGHTISDSFNFPIGRENISAFWMNWNMTATSLFRDYMFYNRWGFRNYNVYCNTMILFTVMGLWHAANPYWILFGMIHGLLFCSFLVWRKYRHRLGHVPLQGTLAAQITARILTYLCVCAGWYLPSKLLQRFSGI